MNGNKLLKYLGQASDHPDFLSFLEQQEIDPASLPNSKLPKKKLDKEKLVVFRNRGFSLEFEEGPAQGTLYLERIVFFKRKEDIVEKHLKLPFDLQFSDKYQRLQQVLGQKIKHGDPKKPYYEEDESDYEYQDYNIVVYFERSDPEEKLQELAVSLKKII